MTTPRYVQCNESDIPEWARFDVPGPNQGQTVEVAYASDNRRYRGEADVGDAYKRVTDRSDGTVRYYRIAR